VFDNAREAIEAYVETLAVDGKPIPETRPRSELQKGKEYTAWSWGIVDVPVE
jgi:predicted RNase H-like HicB family nuclease